jgi:hypothetical protein
MIRAKFSELVLKSCLDDHENGSENSLFQVCITFKIREYSIFSSIKSYFQSAMLKRCFRLV